MKNHIFSLSRLAIVTLATFPAIALAAPPTATPYYTDETNSYVQDQTSQVMGELNSILCFMGAMGPDLMVNSGDANGNYIALVDKNTCDAKGSGGQSNNTGAAYVPAVIHSARATNADPMLVKAWLKFDEQGTTQNISVYATASQAPTTTLPYGVFRMDYCGDTSNCALDKGYINATTSGLSFYSTYNHGSDSGETALQLNASSSSAGNGAISESHSWGGGGVYNFLFAYNTGYFVRNDGAGGADVCFDRSPTNADESVWRYGLYDAATGARVTRNSGFPIEYTVGGVTYNGYIGYWGLWTQGTGPATGDTVQKVTYSQSGATKVPYTLLKTGGKLMKYTTAEKTLAALNKVTFWYYAQNSVTNMAGGSQYEIYWDNTAGQFMVSGKQGTSYNMEPYATPLPLDNAEMVTANPWGIFGWSQMMGGQFGIKGNEFAKLTGASPGTAVKVQTQTQDVVYPSQYAAINTAGGLKCINDCPTVALIAESNGLGPSTTPYTNQGWSPVADTAFVSYTLNGTTGNLSDGVNDVFSTATTGNNANGVRSGRMVTPADATAMIAAKNLANVCGGTCTTFNQGDVDFLPVGSSYYVWETGGQPWNQLAILKDGANNPVTFEAPLQVSFVVPSGAKYGSYQGATISLQYGGFGDLWGIPNECIDVTTNGACDFDPLSATVTAQNNMRWTSKFSIPFDATTGVVTAGATTYYVKPLDKEIRLAKVDCAVAGGLSTAGLSSTGLTSLHLDWSDPTATVGTKPAVTAAPQVIHGVKQY
ncbi:MAG: hypothetical protein OEV15_00295 [Gallionella sp.]|nr:hypothetical protein [Gallionella sp.]